MSSVLEWFEVLPTDWKVKQLKFICDSITTGGTPSAEFIDNSSEHYVNWFTPGDFSEKIILKSSSRKLDFEAIQTEGIRLYPPKTILVVGIGATLGKIGIIEESGYSNQQINALVLSEGFVHEYFALQLSTLSELMKAFANSATLPILNQQRTGAIPILIPPLPTQRRIAAYLDRETAHIDTLIAAKERLLLLMAEKRQALIARAVTRGLDERVKLKDSGVPWLGEVPEGWEVTRLKYKSELISKGTTPSTEGRSTLTVGDVRFLKAENIVDNKLTQLPENYIDLDTDEILKRSRLRENDILIVIAGATIGKVAIMDREYLPANTNQAVCFIRLSRNENSKYVWYLLQSSFTQNIIWLDVVQSAQPNLSMERIGNFIFPYPSPDEQSMIVKRLDEQTNKIDALRQATQRTIALLKERRSALIAAAVTGQIQVT